MKSIAIIALLIIVCFSGCICADQQYTSGIVTEKMTIGHSCYIEIDNDSIYACSSIERFASIDIGKKYNIVYYYENIGNYNHLVDITES